MAACTLFLSLSCLLLILILSGDIELNPGPEDVVKCVCKSREDSGHMIACDSCLCWSHTSCVNIAPTVADKYPFLCPFLYQIKSLIHFNPLFRNFTS